MEKDAIKTASGKNYKEILSKNTTIQINKIFFLFVNKKI